MSWFHSKIIVEQNKHWNLPRQEVREFLPLSDQADGFPDLLQERFFLGMAFGYERSYRGQPRVECFGRICIEHGGVGPLIRDAGQCEVRGSDPP